MGKKMHLVQQGTFRSILLYQTPHGKKQGFEEEFEVIERSEDTKALWEAILAWSSGGWGWGREPDVKYSLQTSKLASKFE